MSVTLKWPPGQVKGLHALLTDYIDQFFSLPFFFLAPKGQDVKQVVFPGCQHRIARGSRRPTADSYLLTHTVPSWPHRYVQLVWWNNDSSLPAAAVEGELSTNNTIRGEESPEKICGCREREHGCCYKSMAWGERGGYYYVYSLIQSSQKCVQILKRKYSCALLQSQYFLSIGIELGFHH